MKSYLTVDHEDPIGALCGMVIETNYRDIPDDVVAFAKKSILDTVAAMIGGSAMESVAPVVDLVKDMGGKPESYIPFYGGKVPASQAALAIGPMTRTLDIAQIHPVAVHCSEHTLSSLLAATGLKGNVTGKEFITAFSVGQEMMLRIGMGIGPFQGGTVIGGIGTGHYIFESVAAVGKLLGLSQEELANAEGIAKLMTSPHDKSAFTPATHVIKTHMGFVARDAIVACQLARTGVTGPRHEVLSGAKGYLSWFKWQTDLSLMTKGLGEVWELLNVEMKPYPGAKYIQTSLNGMLDQMKKNDFVGEEIASIEVDQATLGYHYLATPALKELRWNPQTTTYDCQFSMPYLVATAALDGDISPSSFTAEARARQSVRNLMTRITASLDSKLPGGASRITVVLKDGRKFSEVYTYADVKGNPQNPFTESELIAKFKKCVPFSAYKLTDEVVDSVIDAILNLEHVDDVVSAVITPLTPQ